MTRAADRKATLAALRAARERLRAALLADLEADPVRLASALLRIVETINSLTPKRRPRRPS